MGDPSNRAKAIFLEAIEDHAPEQWPAFLDRACGGDAGLRAEVERLLRARSQLGSFHEAPRPDLPPTLDEPPAQHTRTAVGPYKLLERIGEGGFGVVFMAEQQEPIRRKVALKLLKPGMDTRQVIARFEAERQALALMDHPNIAHVFDGGADASGHPYFVMELVKGLPITDYCDQNYLTVPQRLELFIHVCQAVQHAHHKGVIHRDLKPSNVLVTLHDGVPVPKVIDFGIAKALGQQLTDKTLFTHFAQMIGTPLYMSPEQAEWSGLDVDTRSDIYSLGVLLYELLTGTTPFDKERLRRADFDEMRRIIREEEPPRPSTRLSTVGQAATTASQKRRSDPRTLSRLFRGELDWIVMRALEKDRDRRYESASAFAADVRRYLSNEPVLACPPSAWYRFHKFARRNKTGLAVAGLVLLFVLSLGGIVGWAVRDGAARQARTANNRDNVMDEVDRDLGEGKRAEALAALERAKQLAAEAAPDPAVQRRLLALQERLDADGRDREFVARFDQIRLRIQSLVDVENSRFARAGGAGFPEIRDAFHEYGIDVGVTAPEQVAARVQGRPEPVRGILIAALAECLLASEGDPQARQWLLATLAADTDAWRTRVRKAGARGDWKVLGQLAREADVRKQPPSFLLSLVNTLPPQMKSARLELVQRIQRAHPDDLWANLGLGDVLRESGRPAESVRYYTAALALRPDNPGVYLNRGNALREAGELDAAIEDYRQSLRIAPGYAVAHNNLGTALRARGRLDDAVAEYRKAIEIKEDYAEAHVNLGSALYTRGRLEDAAAEYRKAVRINKDFAEAHYGLGLALYDTNRLADAAAEFRRAIQIKDDYADAHTGLGLVLYQQGRLPDAIVEHDKAIKINKDSAQAHYGRGLALRAGGRVDDAVAEYREAIRLKQDFAQPHYSLAIVLRSRGRLDDAIAEYRKAIEIKDDWAEPHNNLGNALLARGETDRAVAEYRKAIRIKEEYPEAHNNLGNVLKARGQVDGAITEYRKAVRYKPDYARAYCNLGMALQEQGEFRKALQELRRGHELGSRDPRWSLPSARWVRQCERLVELEGRLPGLLEGKTRPAGAAERIELAGVCSLKRLHRAAARFYEEAFAAGPRLADDLDARHRYSAACAAALAGCDRGEDAAGLTAGERARLRRRALDWLRADLEAWGRRLDVEPARVARVLLYWLTDADLAGVRGPEALARLPESERQPWQKLWGEVAATLARAEGKSPPAKRSDAG